MQGIGLGHRVRSLWSNSAGAKIKYSQPDHFCNMKLFYLCLIFHTWPEQPVQRLWTPSAFKSLESLDVLFHSAFNHQLFISKFFFFFFFGYSLPSIIPNWLRQRSSSHTGLWSRNYGGPERSNTPLKARNEKLETDFRSQCRKICLMVHLTLKYYFPQDLFIYFLALSDLSVKSLTKCFLV